MAGTQFTGGKCKGAGQAKAMLRHDDKEMRKVSEHSNADIDKTRTKQNYSIKGLSYEEKCKFYDERIRSLDNSTNTNKRKDRVTMQSMILYVPVGLSDADAVKWCCRASEILEKKYGAENHIDSDVHLDERHMYYDAEQDAEVMSRIHMHCNYIPEVNGKLNGKAFSSRRNIMDINRQLDTMSKIEFNVSYMTGEGKHPSKSVEALKNVSNASYEQVRDEAEVLLEANQKWSKRLKESEEALQADREALEALESDLQRQRDNFTLEKENWLKTQKNDAMEHLRRSKKLREEKDKLDKDREAFEKEKEAFDLEKQTYKQTLKDKADEQVRQYVQEKMQEMSLSCRRLEGRPLPKAITEAFEKMQNEFQLTV